MTMRGHRVLQANDTGLSADGEAAKLTYAHMGMRTANMTIGNGYGKELS